VGTQRTNGSRYRFGVFELDLRSGELRKNGTITSLPHQPCKILALLVSQPGELITREEIKEQIWGNDTFVDFENGLNSAIKRIRTVLGDDAESPRYIETLPRRGYRFIAPLEKVNGASPAESANGGSSSVLEPSVSSGNGDSLPMATSPPLAAMPGADAEVAASLLTGKEIATPAQAKSRALWRWAMAAAFFVIVAGAGAFLLRPEPPPPKILGYRQLTQDGRGKGDVLATDGARVYFSEDLPRGMWGLAYVSVAGGETVPIPTPLKAPTIEDISRDGSELLVTDRSVVDRVTGQESPFYIVAAVGGATRRVGNVTGHCGAWLADGRIIVESGYDVYLVNQDGSEPRKIVTMPSWAAWPRSSPNGKLIRFSSGGDIWEVGADGTNLHPLLPGQDNPPFECCGSWTLDGKYFFFQSEKGGTSNIWAIREGGSPYYKVNHEPMQVITGPVGTISALTSPDGKKLFVISSPERMKLVRYDARAADFLPYLNGISATDVDFSKDGQWMVYVQFPELTLWRSKVDGSDKVQLTFPPMKAGMPRWSPDGAQIAFHGVMPDRVHVYVIASDGAGTPQLIPDVPGEVEEADPGWSPDGRSLVFSGVPRKPNAIHIMDVRTRNVTTLPGSEGHFAARWSPDGRYLAALLDDSCRIVVYDLRASKWSELGVNFEAGSPQWSRDGSTIYFEGFPEGKPAAIFRVRLRDRRIEQVVSLEVFLFRMGNDLYGQWLGLAPDDSPMVLEGAGPQDIYALDVKLP